MKRGFTLIELLVTVSIISLLASVVAVSVTGAKAKAADAVKKQDLTTLRTAITSYKNDHNGRAPVPVVSGVATYGALVRDDDQAHPNDFADSLKPLVDEHYLPKLPDPKGLFYYAATGQGDDAVVIGSTLYTETSSRSGDAGTCRPFTNQATVEPVGDGSPGSCRLATDPTDGHPYIECPNNQGIYNGIANTQCDDNIDNDGDGKIDYDGGRRYDLNNNYLGPIGQPDPGCASAADNGESPDPTSQPAAYCSSNVGNSDYCLCI